ncbi:hypothetical protein EJ110_NYTH09788 [Nymphaea thermarum]|nr:hypothetical protein EJ110_NYTH09788 [Nymphaea thermarum]
MDEDEGLMTPWTLEGRGPSTATWCDEGLGREDLTVEGAWRICARSECSLILPNVLADDRNMKDLLVKADRLVQKRWLGSRQKSSSGEISGRATTVTNLTERSFVGCRLSFSSSPLQRHSEFVGEFPRPDFELIGRAQGLYAFSSLQELSLLMAVDCVFLDGEYKGSTLIILGRNAALHKVREMPVVGGTGTFRLARGYAIARTHSFSSQTAVVEYDVVNMSCLLLTAVRTWKNLQQSSAGIN